MKVSNIFRLGGLVTVVAGLWTAVNALLPFESTPGWVFVGATVLSIIALFVVYAVQVRVGGLLGLAGFVLAVTGNFVFLGEGLLGDNVFFIGGGLYALGLILLGSASLRAGVFSRWVGWLWIASVVVGIPGFVVGSLMEVLFAAGGVALGAAFVLAGYEVWARRPHAIAASRSRG
jgi:hypothetical protein